jgi:hypothetical protein
VFAAMFWHLFAIFGTDRWATIPEEWSMNMPPDKLATNEQFH